MTVAPTTIADLQDCIKDAAAVTLRGASTKADAATAATIVRLAGIRGIHEYVPDECVFTAGAGTPLSDIGAALAAHGQYMPFDPPFAAAGATIGGTVASGLSGSGRYRYGGIRDFLIGAVIVDGEGRTIRSGGKVVKNAAGFLLHHAVVGSGGRFGALTEVTFKVFPSPETRATVEIRCGSVADAMHAAAAVIAQRFEVEAIDADAGGRLWIRLAGRRATMTARLARVENVLTQACGATASIARLDEGAARDLWLAHGEFSWAPRDSHLVKIPVTPALVSRVADFCHDPERIRFSGAGTLAWVAWPDDLTALSQQLTALGARGMCVRGPAAGVSLGMPIANAFEERVRRVLDPRDRFRAASAPAQ